MCSMTDSLTLMTASASLRLSRWVLRYFLLSWLPSVAKPRGERGGGGLGCTYRGRDTLPVFARSRERRWTKVETL